MDQARSFRLIALGVGLGAVVLGCASEAPPSSAGAGGVGGASGAGLGGTAGNAGGAAGGVAGSAGVGVGGAAGSGGIGGTGGGSGQGGSGAMGGRAGVGGAVGGNAGTGAGGSGASGGAGGSAGVDRSADAAFCAEQLASAATQYEGFVSQYQSALASNQVPRSAANGNVHMVGSGDWTAGFPAGALWILYEATDQESWRTAAEAFTEILYSQRTNTSTHDVGFMINCSYGAGYRLTQDTTYRDVVITAADSLAARYSDVVQATRSWDAAGWQRGDWDYPVIIDNMMNLEVFMHASTLSGDDSYATMGINHALTTDANHFRVDGSSYHVVDYNPSTGAAQAKQTQQGLSDDSAWARGQTWGLYGFTMMYRESSEARFLARAQSVADFYTQSPLMPEDGVPVFDFQAAEEGATLHRDASAAAIAASALIELASFAQGEAGERYLDFAIHSLRSLSSSDYRAAAGQNSNFLLMHSVGSYPESSEVDVAMNYADYYYLEALLRCSRL